MVAFWVSILDLMSSCLWVQAYNTSRSQPHTQPPRPKQKPPNHEMCLTKGLLPGYEYYSQVLPKKAQQYYSPRFAWGDHPHRMFFWPTQTHIQKIVQKHCFFSVFKMCSVEDTVIYAAFGLKSVQNTGFCSVFNALASRNVQFRDLPKPLKTPLFTLFSSIFPCANAAGQLKHIYKKSFKNIVFFSVFTFFPSKTP